MTLSFSSSFLTKPHLALSTPRLHQQSAEMVMTVANQELEKLYFFLCGSPARLLDDLVLLKKHGTQESLVNTQGPNEYWIEIHWVIKLAQLTSNQRQGWVETTEDALLVNVTRKNVLKVNDSSCHQICYLNYPHELVLVKEPIYNSYCVEDIVS